MRWLIYSFIILIVSCSAPDLEQKEVLEKAKKEAIELSSLTKEFMYGMMWLYVDENNNTFSGWVKESYPDKNYKTLGYLKNGQKEGTWLGWHKNGKKKFKQGWEKGNYHGVFNVWYDNGNVQVNGQTKEGEVDGSWKQFYRNGNKNYISENKIGKLIAKKVWRSDGKRCHQSEVVNGNGTFFEYDENGTHIKTLTFRNGILFKELIPK